MSEFQIVGYLGSSLAAAITFGMWKNDYNAGLFLFNMAVAIGLLTLIAGAK